MEVIIFMIIIGIYFYSMVQKSVKKVNEKRENITVKSDGASWYGTQAAGSAGRAQVKPQNRQFAGTQSNMQNRQFAGTQSSVQNRQPAGSSVAGRTEKSTTEMLEEKARQDAMEHQEEKRRQLAEERRIHGQLRYAERYLPGDMIPQGRRLVCCGYCNAENLIPERDNPKRYNCYFCRETL